MQQIRIEDRGSMQVPLSEGCIDSDKPPGMAFTHAPGIVKTAAGGLRHDAPLDEPPQEMNLSIGEHKWLHVLLLF